MHACMRGLQGERGGDRPAGADGGERGRGRQLLRVGARVRPAAAHPQGPWRQRG